MPALLALSGGAVDFNALSRQKGQIQHVADAAALAVGRQMTMMQMSDSQLQNAAQQFATANSVALGLEDLAISAVATTDRLGLRVDAKARAKAPLGILDLLSGVQALSASATARVGQDTKLCLLSVSDTRTSERATKMFISREPIGIDIGPGARLTAPGCLLHTNISTKTAFSIAAGAKVKASVVCAIGGVQNSGGLVEAAVLDSCPRVQNPMESRAYPSVGQNCTGVTYKDTVFKGGTHTMTPGNYCGNVFISGDAKVRMSPGVYAIQGRLT
ncbi:MAG: pilus assembly protein TadG-related protein, partial [Rhabdaerophilum sp.]